MREHGRSKTRIASLPHAKLAPTTAMRQLGVGSQGDAEALAIFHQLLFDEWAEGRLTDRVACKNHSRRKTCFGVIEWKAVREAASRFLPKHTAAAGWKHRSLSHVERDGLAAMPKDRGVDGPLECSLALGGGGG